MSKKRYLSDKFWTDSYIESLSPDYKLVFLYLLTNPQMNVAGVYEIRPKRIAFETGYDIEVIQNILDRFQEDKKIIYKDDWIVVINFFKHLALGYKTAQGVNRIINKSPDSIKNLFSLKNVENTKDETYSVYVLDAPYMPHTRGSHSDVSSNKLVVGSNKLVVGSNKLVVKDKESGEKNKNVQEIPELIKAFENVNPNCKRFYGNKTQRGACSDLIETYGFDRVMVVIENTLPTTNRMEYFPTIITPLQLRDKWVALESAIRKKQSKQKILQNNVAFR